MNDAQQECREHASAHVNTHVLALNRPIKLLTLRERRCRRMPKAWQLGQPERMCPRRPKQPSIQLAKILCKLPYSSFKEEEKCPGRASLTHRDGLVLALQAQHLGGAVGAVLPLRPLPEALLLQGDAHLLRYLPPQLAEGRPAWQLECLHLQAGTYAFSAVSDAARQRAEAGAGTCRLVLQANHAGRQAGRRTSRTGREQGNLGGGRECKEGTLGDKHDRVRTPFLLPSGTAR